MGEPIRSLVLATRCDRGANWRQFRLPMLVLSAPMTGFAVGSD